MEEEKLERSIRKSEIPGLTREEEEAQLAKVIGIAEQNLEQAKADIRSANEDLADRRKRHGDHFVRRLQSHRDNRKVRCF